MAATSYYQLAKGLFHRHYAELDAAFRLGGREAAVALAEELGRAYADRMADRLGGETSATVLRVQWHLVTRVRNAYPIRRQLECALADEAMREHHEEERERQRRLGVPFFGAGLRGGVP